MSLKPAIGLLEDEIAALNKHAVGTDGWHLQQAKYFGLSLLRRAEQLGVEGVSLDTLRQRLRTELMESTVAGT